MTTFRRLTDDLTRSLVKSPRIEKQTSKTEVKYVREEKLSAAELKESVRKDSIMGMKTLTNIFASKKPIPVSATPTPSKKVKTVYPTKLNKV